MGSPYEKVLRLYWHEYYKEYDFERVSVYPKIVNSYFLTFFDDGFLLPFVAADKIDIRVYNQ